MPARVRARGPKTQISDCGGAAWRDCEENVDEMAGTDHLRVYSMMRHGAYGLHVHDSARQHISLLNTVF